MNGGSPLNSALSSSFNFVPNLPFPMDFGSSHNLKSENSQRHVLTVHPTSVKSRVETQIPIRLTLYPLPAGVTKLRLPGHTISKLKFLAPPATEPSPDTLELHTSLVCTSAMQDEEKLKKAFARARGEPYRSSDSSSRLVDGSQEDDKPVDGGQVKICSGCIQRERKRASRKKQRKPEEDELFQKYEEQRVIVFNTNEIKEWNEPSRSAVSGYGDVQLPAVPAGAMQVELPMRIACYCRHQNEKLGFQFVLPSLTDVSLANSSFRVIFTLKDHKQNVVSQAITNSIMITDDHKTHNAPAPPAPGPSPVLPDGTQLPGVGVFPSGPCVDAKTQQKLDSQSYPTAGAYSASQNPNSQASRSLSRQTSPNDFQGPTSKRRKHSSSGKLPPELMMTRVESQSTGAYMSGVNNASQSPASRGFASPMERPFVTASAMSGQFASGPPTPNSNDNNPFFNPAAQHQSLDSIVQQQLLSAPNSSHPSRPASPGGSTRNGFQDQNLSLSVGPSTTPQMWPLTSAGNRLPSVIHKLVPAEGSISGGTEVTLLGSGFYPGMEVVFGDTLATTTTFWGDKCLNCLTPPALQPGLVAVVFKHEHPTYGQMQPAPPLIPKQQLFFRYVDDRELQMYRLALGILGHKLGNQADAFHTAQQIMGSDPKALLNMQKDMHSGSSSHQRQVPGLDSQGKMSDLDSKMLTYLEFVDLDDSPRPPKYNSRCATGQTLLHFAASLGLTRFVAGLLARGANPDVQDTTGNTPMHLAALNGHAHIVNKLRLAGANANARSIRRFTPADLATTLPAHQAALLPSNHRRSRSVGSLSSSRRRQSSSASLSSLWETSSASGSFDHADYDSDDPDEDSAEVESSPDNQDSELNYNASRRSSVQQDANQTRVYSREGDMAAPNQTPSEQAGQPGDGRGFSPPATLIAWRNQLAVQINQFQQSVASTFPNLPALPPMPALPDYQAHPMMRRITNLVPHRPTGTRPARDGWWDRLKGNSTQSNSEPPAYDELYPDKEDDEEMKNLKKTSMLRAATEAAVDQHFEAQASSSETAARKEQKEEIQDIRIGRKVISREQQKHLREHQARRMKGLASDRNLYFIWVSDYSRHAPRWNVLTRFRSLSCFLLSAHGFEVLFRASGLNLLVAMSSSNLSTLSERWRSEIRRRSLIFIMALFSKPAFVRLLLLHTNDGI